MHFKKFNPKTEVAYLHTAVININPEKTILYYDSFFLKQRFLYHLTFHIVWIVLQLTVSIRYNKLVILNSHIVDKPPAISIS